MEFRIADTFSDSLARLTNDEQRAAKTTAFDLQMDPAGAGKSFHRLDKAKDKNFWSVRVNDDIRIIVHRSDASLLLCYVGHHEAAYNWAERRKLETHPRTGAAQLVEIRETVKNIIIPVYVPEETPPTKKSHSVAKAASGPVSRNQAQSTSLFTKIPDDELLSYGVPPEWLPDVKAATEETLLPLVEHLPAEAAEALLELATGGTPRVPEPVLPITDPFNHPDALRRFRVMSNVEELKQALEYPWEKWMIFLHPEQRQLVDREFGGPARVSGSAGTGKTIVALHRAVGLARRHPDARVLLTTFSDALANALQDRLKRLLGNEPRLGERIDVHSLPALGRRLFQSLIGKVVVTDREVVRDIIKGAGKKIPDHKFSGTFLIQEWEQIVNPWQLKTWDAYRDFVRLGRRTRLPEAQRKVLWSIFEQVFTELKKRNLATEAGLFTALASAITSKKTAPFDFVVIDEAQDVTPAHLRFFAALGGNRPNALFFAGDQGQRIFQHPFSWKALGVDVRGRARNLRVNYRTSHQIRVQADRLLEAEVNDVDGITEVRSDTVSVFNGPPPMIKSFDSEKDEIAAVGTWLANQAKTGVLPHEFGVFVRSEAQLSRAQAAVKKAGLAFKVLDEQVNVAPGHVAVSTMHLAKGLEFRAVVVMACDDEVIPLQDRIENVGDDADLEEVYATERHLLYVACTRARDILLITSLDPASEFIDDLQMPEKG